jgi:hypothetical protein
MTGHYVDIQVPGPGRIEDHHAHLLRLHYLDRCLHFASGNDNHAIDAHCLRLLSERAIVVAAYIDGTQRAGVEIVADRTAQRAQAVVTAEPGFQSHPLMQALIARAAEEARKRHFSEIHFRGVELASGQYDTQIARSA